MARRSGYERNGWAWQATVVRILQRDHHACYTYAPAHCIGIATTADHLVPVSRGGTHGDENLSAICGPCHELKSEHERVAGIKAQPRARRALERHPGLA